MKRSKKKAARVAEGLKKAPATWVVPQDRDVFWIDYTPQYPNGVWIETLHIKRTFWDALAEAADDALTTAPSSVLKYLGPTPWND